jgi:hypothetical protein
VPLLVYTDYRAFAQFVDGLGSTLDLVLIGRLRPEAGRSHYVLRPPSGFIQFLSGSRESL